MAARQQRAGDTVIAAAFRIDAHCRHCPSGNGRAIEPIRWCHVEELERLPTKGRRRVLRHLEQSLMHAVPEAKAARARRRGLLAAQLLVGALLLFPAQACVFFEVPRDRATELLLTPVHSRSPSRQKDVPARFAGPNDPGWSKVQLGLRAWSTVSGACFDREVETLPLECWRHELPAAKDGEELSIEFLLVSDAQTRDERAYEPGQLRWIDVFIEPTIRLPLVEVMDGIVLQAFVSAYRQHVERSRGEAPSRFLIQGGDLLDVSLVTELVEAYETLSRAERKLPIYSVVGNHDGLTWGNLPDSRTKTWELGINRKEFVLGGVLYSPRDDGFGFASNEIVSGLRLHQPKLLAALPETTEALDRIRRYKSRFDKRNPSELLPITVKGLVSVSRIEDRRNQLGYYSFDQEEVRFIILDTAATDSVVADIDPVQLGWLYLQLREAWKTCRPVVLVSHHGPDDFPWHRRWPLRRIFQQFPNIVVHLHGHGHEPRAESIAGVPVVETPSIIDYPEAGSLVRIFQGKDGSSLRVSISLVRPELTCSNGDAMALQSLLEETWITSYYDQPGRFRDRYGPYRAVCWRRDGARSYDQPGRFRDRYGPSRTVCWRRDGARPISKSGSNLSEVDGSLQITWQPRCKGSVPPAADFFGSQKAADESRRARQLLGLDASW